MCAYCVFHMSCAWTWLSSWCTHLPSVHQCCGPVSLSCPAAVQNPQAGKIFCRADMQNMEAPKKTTLERQSVLLSDERHREELEEEWPVEELESSTGQIHNHSKDICWSKTPDFFVQIATVVCQRMLPCAGHHICNAHGVESWCCMQIQGICPSGEEVQILIRTISMGQAWDMHPNHTCMSQVDETREQRRQKMLALLGCSAFPIDLCPCPSCCGPLGLPIPSLI